MSLPLIDRQSVSEEHHSSSCSLLLPVFSFLSHLPLLAPEGLYLPQLALDQQCFFNHFSSVARCQTMNGQ